MKKSSQFHGPAALTPEKELPPLPVGLEAGWAPEPVWMLWNTEKSLDLQGIEPQTVGRRYINWAIPAHL
jgi:hypothetical protein